jgi:predicted benzoate:H+ symporter BenE
MLLYGTLLRHIMLLYTALRSVTLDYAALCLCYATLRSVKPVYAVYAILHSSTLHYALLRCSMVLCYATLRYSTLHYALLR